MFREFSLFKTSMGILLLSYKPICNFFSQAEMKDRKGHWRTGKDSVQGRQRIRMLKTRAKKHRIKILNFTMRFMLWVQEDKLRIRCRCYHCRVLVLLHVNILTEVVQVFTPFPSILNLKLFFFHVCTNDLTKTLIICCLSLNAFTFCCHIFWEKVNVKKNTVYEIALLRYKFMLCFNNLFYTRSFWCSSILSWPTLLAKSFALRTLSDH